MNTQISTAAQVTREDVKTRKDDLRRPLQSARRQSTAMKLERNFLIKSGPPELARRALRLSHPHSRFVHVTLAFQTTISIDHHPIRTASVSDTTLTREARTTITQHV